MGVALCVVKTCWKSIPEYVLLKLKCVTLVFIALEPNNPADYRKQINEILTMADFKL